MPPIKEQESESSSVNHAKLILVVDDEPEIVESIEFALTRQGYDVLTAHDGNEALAIAETKKPDAMILDIMMPKRSGFLVLEYMRQSNCEPIPTIVITGNEGKRHREYVKMLGVNEYFCKPVTIDLLIEAVERLVGKAKS